ncbi:MAG: hypothetical protein FWF76_00890, partial [Oscillospiraceae bacterium]|nr:hypothetical protein [Oscillospiraceae bacterium]
MKNKKRILSILLALSMVLSFVPLTVMPAVAQESFQLQLIARSISNSDWENDSSDNGVDYGTCITSGINWWSIPPHSGNPPASHCICTAVAICWTVDIPSTPDNLRGAAMTVPAGGGTGLTATLNIAAPFNTNTLFTSIALVSPGLNTRDYVPAGTAPVPSDAQIRVTSVSFGTIDTANNTNWLGGDHVDGAASFNIWNAFEADGRRLTGAQTTSIGGNQMLTLTPAPTTLTVTFDVFYDNGDDGPDPNGGNGPDPNGGNGQLPDSAGGWVVENTQE